MFLRILSSLIMMILAVLSTLFMPIMIPVVLPGESTGMAVGKAVRLGLQLKTVTQHIIIPNLEKYTAAKLNTVDLVRFASF